jgi:hypothetical protein
MRLLVRSVLTLTLTLAAGCSTVDTPLSPHERRDVLAALWQWNRSPARSAYRYELQQLCFCPTEIVSWNTITVVDNVVVNVVSERGDPVPRARWTQFPTVDQLFERVLAELEPELADITVQFDAQYGYPMQIAFTYDAQIADAGVIYNARRLVPVARP